MGGERGDASGGPAVRSATARLRQRWLQSRTPWGWAYRKVRFLLASWGYRLSGRYYLVGKGQKYRSISAALDAIALHGNGGHIRGAKGHVEVVTETISITQAHGHVMISHFKMEVASPEVMQEIAEAIA